MVKSCSIVKKLLLSEERELKYFRGTDYLVSSQFHPKTLAKCKVLKTHMDTDKKKVLSNEKLVIEGK